MADDVSDATARLPVDIRRVNMPLVMAVGFLIAFLGGASGVLTAQFRQSERTSAIQSDVRDIATQIKGQRDVDMERARLQDERLAAMRGAIDQNARQQDDRVANISRAIESGAATTQASIDAISSTVSALSRSMDDMKRRQELQQYEIQGVKDQLKDVLLKINKEP